MCGSKVLAQVSCKMHKALADKVRSGVLVQYQLYEKFCIMLKDDRKVDTTSP